MIFCPSQYFSPREEPIKMLVFHCLAYCGLDAIKSLEDNQVSSHYIIDNNGEIFQCVKEQDKAWHAGDSFWQGAKNVNSQAVGIELCHPTLGQTAFAPKQIESLISLSQDIIKRYSISPTNIVGHSDISPTRKADPGKNFPWQKLAKNGIGLWYEQKSLPETNIKTLLDIIGYNTTSPEEVTASCYAFRRRFMPQTIDEYSIKELINNPYPKSSVLPKDFISTLQKTAYIYQKNS